MEKVAAVLASVLKVDPTTIDLTNEDAIKSLEERAKSLKVFTSDEFNSTMNNYKDSLKDTFYKEHKINIHGAIEKGLVEKYGLDGESLKGKRTEDYIEAAMEKLGKSAKPADDKELEKLTKLLQDTKTDYEKKIGETTKQYEDRLRDMALGVELKGIENTLDIEDAEKRSAQLEFIKYQFNKEYSVVEKDGKYVVMKGDEVARDANYNPLTVSEALATIAEKFAPIKKKAPAGRKSEPGGKSGNHAIDWSAFTDFQSFMATERGKDLTPGSKEWAEMYGQFRKAKGLE